MLTKRRAQFLERILGLHRDTGRPVHYADVAGSLGVSKWTAYDVLKELEKEGYLRSEYVVNNAERVPGRSMLMYVPFGSFSGAPEAPGAWATRMESEEWQHVKQKILRTLAGLKNAGRRKILATMTAEMDEEMSCKNSTSITFCAYTIGVLAVHAAAAGRKTAKTLGKLVNTSPKPELGLSVFAGTVMGILMKKANIVPGMGTLTGYVTRYQRHLAEFSAEQRRLLFEFLRETLEYSL